MKSDGAKKRDAEEQLDPEGQPGMVKRNSSNESSTDSSNEYHLSSESSESASPREPQKKASPIIDSDSGEVSVVVHTRIIGKGGTEGLLVGIALNDSQRPTNISYRDHGGK